MTKIERSEEWWMKKAASEETDEQFVERMARLEATPEGRMDPDVGRLFDLARRGAAAADRIAQLEAALREISLMDKQYEHDLFSATCVARAALGEERT
jgi:hypothetical protein